MLVSNQRMIPNSSPASPSAWRAAMLGAGVLLNLSLLDSLSRDYSLIAHPAWLFAAISLGALFLCFAVLLLPAKLISRSGTSFVQTVEECIGARPAWVFQKLVVTVWAAGWFSSICWYAIYGLEQAIDSAPLRHGERSRALTVGVALFWLLMIAPAATVSLAEVARWSIWLTKVSFCAVVGLLLSAATLLPQVMDRLEGLELEWRYLLGLEPSILLWTVPPLFLAVPLMAEPLATRRGRLIVFGAGIALPLLIGILAALLTTAGATTLSVINTKYPSYIAYILARPVKLGWVKILVMMFTLLTASRLAAHVCAEALPGRRSWGKAVAVTALLLACNFALWKAPWGFRVWQMAAIPFAPLAGVLGGTYLAGAGPRRQAGSTVAWLAGCLVTSLPMFAAEYPSYSGIWPAWVIFGWLVSLAGTYMARVLLGRARANQPGTK